MSARVSFADLLKAGADKEQQRLNLKPAPPAPAALASVTPDKDFSKMPNSIKRAVKDGSFPNSSLAVYLYLYSLTRGAVDPKRSVRISKPKLLAGANLRSEKALFKNLAHLKNIGFLKITVFNGDHLGNEFEVFVPEEIGENNPLIPPTYLPTNLRTKSTQVPTVLRTVGRWVLNPTDADVYGNPKTSFKDFKENDDEPAALGGRDSETARRGAMEKIFNEFSKKIIGKELKSEDDEKLKELAELLVMELEIAAARTDSISNVPAFLTEHLRRRLSRKSENQSAGKPSSKKTLNKSRQIGKADNPVQDTAEIYQAEPLTAHARETVLKTMREYIEKGQREFIANLRETYTTEDWKWLSENLPKEKTKKTGNPHLQKPELKNPNKRV